MVKVNTMRTSRVAFAPGLACSLTLTITANMAVSIMKHRPLRLPQHSIDLLAGPVSSIQGTHVVCFSLESLTDRRALNAPVNRACVSLLSWRAVAAKRAENLSAKGIK